ncbi:XisH family protein [Pseudanabaena sp. BC1403]|uniref:XisH family protein n=1 Tax=Pseudanabaena sp. BC1403 TaxID=2043171 RepID=UPI000CD9A6DE|nr:XisH family protein [Pseudanabaena sp. BC1403]
MSARDIFHNAVKIALEKDGWTITHDPLSLEFGLGSLYVDLGAERIIAAERRNEKIAIEIKSFLSGSAVSEFHTALGQYLNYRLLMQEQYTEYKLYLAIPLSTYDSFFQLPFIQMTIQQYQLKLAIYLPEEEEIVKWQS